MDRYSRSRPEPIPNLLDDRVRLLLALSTAEFERTGAQVARARAEQALALCPGQSALEAMCHSQLASIWGRSDQPIRARDELDLAARGLVLMPARERLVILINRGMVSLDLADIRAAQRDFEAAAELAAEHGLTRQEFMARHNLGYAAYVAGDLPRALTLMAAADAMPSDASRAASRLDHGRVLLEAGLVNEAIELLSGARQVCEHDGLRQLRGETDVELARGYLQLGSFEPAVRHARSARRSFRRRDALGWRAWAQLWEWAAMLAQEHRPARWRAIAEQVARIADDHAGTRLGLEAALTAAQVALRLADEPAATAWLARAEPITRTGSLRSLLRYRFVQADAACTRGDGRATTTVLRRAARELARARSNSGSLDVRSAYALHGVALAQYDLRLAHGRGAVAVLTATERWRASAAGIPPVRPPQDPELADWIAELRRLREQLQEQMMDSGGGSRQDAARAYRLEQAISRRGWMLADAGGSGSVPGSTGGRHLSGSRPPVTLTQARQLLKDRDATLVSYYPLHGRLGAVVAQRSRVRMYDVADLAQVSEFIRRLDADLRVVASMPVGDVRKVVWASLAGDLARIEELLLEPLGVDGRLVVVPSAAMEGLPWGMLASRRGQPTTIAQSLTTWARGTVDHEPTGVTGLRRGVVALAGPDLRYAGEEVSAVARAWGESATAYRRGTSAELSGALATADVVHVAAHGLHHAQSPLFSSVRMVDGPLFTFDLQHSGVGAGHVVLSACDVGQSAWRAGEERLGLAAGLLALGARSVVAGVCRIPDDVAGAVMGDYHRRLAAGVDAAEALAAAAERASGSAGLAGAFVAMGSDWRRGG